MTSRALRKTFLDFFERRGHKVVSSSSLLPADPTSLFTSAGMQQFVPYLSGETEPPYYRACSVQKCLRVDDIDEVGDSTHHTFFEMLGNWSFGDYFKERAIDFALEFLVKKCGLSKKRLWISIFKGGDGIPRDDEAEGLWEKKGIPKEKIFEYCSKDNFWGPVAATGPCGPCSEIFYDKTEEPCGEDCHPNCSCGRFVEIWNLVFMEYNKTLQGNFAKLSKQNVDTGVGFERLLSILQKEPSVYKTDLFLPIIEEIEFLSAKKYKGKEKEFRILADHIRAVCFIRAEGVLPSNTDRGYVLRRLLRRIFRFAYDLGIKPGSYKSLVEKVAGIYRNDYPEIKEKKEDILETINKEEKQYGRTLKKGLKKFEKLLKGRRNKIIEGQEAFNLYQSYGFPLELTRELAKEKGFRIDEKGYKEALLAHQKESRKGAKKKFGGLGIKDLIDEENIKKATRLHTATHLLHQALREILGKHVGQMGSDITPKRLRFDFSHGSALEKEELKKIENLVNQKIEEDLIVKKEKMPYDRAIKSGALAFFKEKYPREVFVYTIGKGTEGIFSREICAGPHVKNTSSLGRFRIIKEESAGAGIRRIKAILE